jgi:hypothetical protein
MHKLTLEDIRTMSLYEYDEIEMQCYCEKDCGCKNTIAYVNHHEWGRTEDYTCKNCLDKCELT